MDALTSCARSPATAAVRLADGSFLLCVYHARVQNNNYGHQHRSEKATHTHAVPLVVSTDLDGVAMCAARACVCKCGNASEIVAVCSAACRLPKVSRAEPDWKQMESGFNNRPCVWHAYLLPV